MSSLRAWHAAVGSGVGADVFDMTAVYMDKGAAESVKLKPEEVHDVEDEVEIFFSESSAQS
jgi:hypothetical protein